MIGPAEAFTGPEQHDPVNMSASCADIQLSNLQFQLFYLGT